MSIPVLIGDTQTRMPTSWEDINIHQYHEITKWRIDAQRNPNAIPNMVRMYSILLNIPYNIMKKVQIRGVANIVETNLKWMQNDFKLEGARVPKEVEIGGKTIKVPKDIELIEFGQFIAVENGIRKLLKKGHEEERMLTTISILLFKQLSDEEFTIARAKKLRGNIQGLSIIHGARLELFFWKKYKELKNGKPDGWAVNLMPTWLKRVWTNWKNSASLKQSTL